MGGVERDAAIKKMALVVGATRRRRRQRTVERVKNGMTTRWRSGQRTGIALLAVLVLLVLHHPAMSAMSAMPLSGHAAPIVLMPATPASPRSSGSPATDARPRVTCPAFRDMSCPMRAVARGRPALLPPVLSTRIPFSWASARALDARLSDDGVIGVARDARTARARRAILQVFLL